MLCISANSDYHGERAIRILEPPSGFRCQNLSWAFGGFMPRVVAASEILNKGICVTFHLTTSSYLGFLTSRFFWP